MSEEKKMITFEGSENYVVSDELANAVNVAIALEKPLLIKGEPGTGKTMLAEPLPSFGYAAFGVEHQVNYKGSGRALCV